jgi:hypothetical protein
MFTDAAADPDHLAIAVDLAAERLGTIKRLARLAQHFEAA